MLANKLSLQLKWNDAHKFRHEYKRIKFSLTKSSYEELMKRIEKDNDTLAHLTGQSLRLEPTRLRRGNRITDFDRVRSQADSLYRVLKKNWCCTCQTPHKASLRLEARTAGSVDTESERMRFRMVFSFDIDPSIAHSIPWKPKETEIEPLEITEEEIAASKVSLGSLAELSVTSTNMRLSRSLTPRPRPKPGVRWASDTSEGSSSSTLAVRSLTTRSTDSLMVQIQNLCSAFKDWKGTEACLGFLADEQSMRHGVYPILQPIHHETPKVVSLYKRLDSPHVPSAKLTRRERLNLALTLASSVLQLHKTPWLNERWGKDDILFLEGTEGPFVSKSFLPISSAQPQNSFAPLKSLPIVRNETVFALGVILIELCLGSALENMRSEEDLGDDGTPNSLTDYMTARRLVSEVYEEGGGRYGDAVRRCIHCEFDQRNASLDVEAFRQSFYQGVIQPLEDDWTDFCSMNILQRPNIF